MIPARSGRRHVLHLLHAMMARPEIAVRRETDLGELLRHATQAIPRRSLVFLVSDFISTPGWEKPLARLARRHETLAVKLHDPLESALPDLGVLVIEDAETGEQLTVDLHDRGFRERFAAGAKRREAKLLGGFGEAGVDALELSTEDPLADSILRFAELRKHGGKHRRTRDVSMA